MSHSGQSSGGLSTTLESAEQEERRIKKELENRGIKEEMPLGEMKKLLDLIISTELKDDSKPIEADRNSSPVPLSPSGQQSYSDKLKLDNDRKSKSPELSLNRSSKSLSREKQTDSSDDLIKGPNKMNSNRTEPKGNVRRNMNRGRCSEGKNENKRILQKPDGRMKLEEKQPVLKLTLQDFHNEEQDQRLIPRYRLTDKKSSQDGNRMMKPSEKEGLIFDRLRKHLLQTAEICHNQCTSSVALNYQWGTAIKVGTSNQMYNTRSNCDTNYRQ